MTHPAAEEPAAVPMENDTVCALLDAAFRELQHDTGPQDKEYAFQRGVLAIAFRVILRKYRQPARELSAHQQAGRVSVSPGEPRFYIDHGMIHDRITGRHVHGDREIEAGLADEALLMLNELHYSALREIKLASGDDNYIAWARYVTQHDKPSRIVLCDSDSEGAFKVYRNAMLSARAASVPNIALDTIAGVIQSWLDWDERHGEERNDDCHVMSVPVWPSRGTLKNWISALRGQPASVRAGDGEPVERDMSIEQFAGACVAAGSDWMAEAKRLREALAKYGGHLGACAGGAYSDGALRCDCGYEKALKS